MSEKIDRKCSNPLITLMLPNEYETNIGPATDSSALFSIPRLAVIVSVSEYDP